MNNRWAGRWLMVVAILHTVFGGVTFFQPLQKIFSEGIFNTVLGHQDRKVAFWFLMLGFILLILGYIIDYLESHALRHTFKLTGFGILVISTVGIILIPTSGFWLLFPAAIRLLYKSNKVSHLQHTALE